MEINEADKVRNRNVIIVAVVIAVGIILGVGFAVSKISLAGKINTFASELIRTIADNFSSDTTPEKQVDINDIINDIEVDNINTRSDLKTIAFTQSLYGTKGEKLYSVMNSGNLVLKSGAEKNTIASQIKYEGVEPFINYEMTNNVGVMEISSYSDNNEERTINLPSNQAFNVEIISSAGNSDINLEDIVANVVNVDMRAGNLRFIPPSGNSSESTIIVDAGNINILASKQIGLYVILSNSVGSISFNSEFIKINNGIQSKDYNSKNIKAKIIIHQIAGNLDISTLDRLIEK